MDIYRKLSKCIRQTPCLFEHYLVTNIFKTIFKLIYCITRMSGRVIRVGGPNGHVTDDVTWPQKVGLEVPIFLRFCISIKPAIHKPGIRARHSGKRPGFSDTQAALSGPGHPARVSLDPDARAPLSMLMWPFCNFCCLQCVISLLLCILTWHYYS